MKEKYFITEQEMNDYLSKIGGLENGMFKDRPKILDCGFFQVSEGWYFLIKTLIDDLIELGWDKKILQVKEKWGGLRFYISSGSYEIHERIEKAESESYKICEVTGEPGEIRTDIGWIRTLSDSIYLEIKNKK